MRFFTPRSGNLGKQGRRISSTVALGLLLSSCLIAQCALANNLSVQVTDSTGQALVDAVVFAEPTSGPIVLKTPRRIEIEQKGRKFLPTVTVIQTGSEIIFPNRDTVRHHIYSYSQAKTFDVKLYSGTSSPTEVFDKAGLVVLGCNIHDAMVAYVQVVSTPWFGKTDASGKVKLEGLPLAAYKLKAWHPGMPPAAAPVEQSVTLSGAETNASVRLNVKPVGI